MFGSARRPVCEEVSNVLIAVLGKAVLTKSGR